MLGDVLDVAQLIANGRAAVFSDNLLSARPSAANLDRLAAASAGRSSR
jgi:hypothetical protein